MIIDLHAHSSRSDGTDTPAALVSKAAGAGIDVLALTDHDTTQGWAEASAAAERFGVRLVRGLELSTKNAGRGQHLLAYEPDPANAPLQRILREGQQSRQNRVPAMVDRLRTLGIDVTVEDVTAHAGTATVGRPHVADALVTAGACRDRDEAFATLLAPGGPAYVSRYTPTIEDAIAAVVHAGGAAVIAHPWGRKSHVTEERFAELAACGLAGIEVDHQEHDQAARAELRGIATNLGLVITGSSDHHGAGKVNHELGCNTTDPQQYERLLGLIETR